jgi:hypothetical protein
MEFLAADPEVPSSIPGATRYFCIVVGLERSPLSLVRINEELKNGVFWDVMPCGSCKNRRFGGTWRLLHQGDKNR